MIDPFESPKRTLAWAKHRLNNFHAKLAQITSDNGRAYIIEPNLNGVPEAHKIKFDRELFGDLACIAFDFTNNLRSVLDQMNVRRGSRRGGGRRSLLGDSRLAQAFENGLDLG